MKMGQWAKRKTSKQPDGNFEATKDQRLSMNSAFLKYVLQTEVDTLSQVFRTFKQRWFSGKVRFWLETKRR